MISPEKRSSPKNQIYGMYQCRNGYAKMYRLKIQFNCMYDENQYQNKICCESNCVDLIN